MKCKLLNMTWKSQDFSGGPVVKNLPASAGDMGSIPGWGRFHLLGGKLGPCFATREATQWEACMPQREKAHTQQQTPSTAKNK